MKKINRKIESAETRRYEERLNEWERECVNMKYLRKNEESDGPGRDGEITYERGRKGKRKGVVALKILRRKKERGRNDSKTGHSDRMLKERE